MNERQNTTLPTVARPLGGLPPGWRDADDQPEVDAWMLARRRRRFIIVAVVVAVLLLEGVGVVVWNAQSHYSRGQSALAVGADALAAQEFSQATLLGLPYRDADALEAGAMASLTSDIEKREAEVARRGAVLTRLRRAADALAAGDAQAVLTAARAARKAGLARVADDYPRVADTRRDLVGDVALAARAALEGSEWRDAGLLAAAVISLDGTSDEWTDLARRAEKGAELAAIVERARDAADRRAWRTALRLAEQVLARRSDFPGAAQVAERARAALAAAPPASGSGGGTSTQPPPP
ncbi:MAG: hypothetical protein GX624_07575 [Actinobacteria bacterium]|nr:hypothetical protein [Actinomycetota bacterium]